MGPVSRLACTVELHRDLSCRHCIHALKDVCETFKLFSYLHALKDVCEIIWDLWDFFRSSMP